MTSPYHYSMCQLRLCTAIVWVWSTWHIVSSDGSTTEQSSMQNVAQASSQRRRFMTAADQLLEDQKMLARFRSTGEQAHAAAIYAHGTAMANHNAGVAVGSTYGPPLSQQCCRVCSSEDDVGLGITSFLEAQGPFGRRTAQPPQCNTSWVNYQL